MKVSSETWSSLFTVKKDCIGIAGQGGRVGRRGGTGWSPLRNPLLSFLATARTSDGGHTVGEIGLGGAEGQFQKTRMVGRQWTRDCRRLRGDQGTGQSTVASTRCVNKPGTRVEAVWAVWVWEMRDAMRCTIVRAHGEKTGEKSHTQSQQEAVVFAKKLACPCHQEPCHAIHTPSLLGSKLPKFQPATQRQGFPKTRGWGASTQAHHASSPNSQPPRARVRVRVRVHRTVVQTLDGPCFSTIR